MTWGVEWSDRLWLIVENIYILGGEAGLPAYSQGEKYIKKKDKCNDNELFVGLINECVYIMDFSKMLVYEISR